MISLISLDISKVLKYKYILFIFDSTGGNEHEQLFGLKWQYDDICSIDMDNGMISTTTWAVNVISNNIFNIFGDIDRKIFGIIDSVNMKPCDDIYGINTNSL